MQHRIATLLTNTDQRSEMLISILKSDVKKVKLICVLKLFHYSAILCRNSAYNRGRAAHLPEVLLRRSACCLLFRSQVELMRNIHCFQWERCQVVKQKKKNVLSKFLSQQERLLYIDVIMKSSLITVCPKLIMGAQIFCKSKMIA